jgi:hypothetical protein
LWLAAAVAAADALVPLRWEGTQYGCKCTPADACWPKDSEWKSLNETVDGTLLFDVPPGAACHDSFEGIETYNAAACAAVNANWTSEQWQ